MKILSDEKKFPSDEMKILSFLVSERAAEGEGELRVLAAQRVVVGLGGLAVVDAEAGVGLQSGAGEEEGVFDAGAKGVLWGYEVLIFAIEEGLHGSLKLEV